MNVEEALAYAAIMHEGQVDEAGRPLVEHLARVSEALRRERFRSAQALGKPDVLDGETARAELIAAALHDVLKRSEATADELLALGCSPAAVDAVVALTRRDGEPYAPYLARAAADPLARRVARACSADRGDEAVAAELDEWDRYWSVVESQRGQPGGYFQYFIEREFLGRQWRWRETGAERTFAWPELIHPVKTGGLWQAAGRDALRGSEIPLEQAHRVAAGMGVDLGAPRARDWTAAGPAVRFGGQVFIEKEPPAKAAKPKPEPEKPGLLTRIFLGAVAGLGTAALFQRLRSAQQRKPKE